jgi:hypothetical protein
MPKRIWDPFFSIYSMWLGTLFLLTVTCKIVYVPLRTLQNISILETNAFITGLHKTNCAWWQWIYVPFTEKVISKKYVYIVLGLLSIPPIMYIIYRIRSMKTERFL